MRVSCSGTFSVWVVLLLVVSAVGSPVGIAGLAGAETAGNTESVDKHWPSFLQDDRNTGHHAFAKPPAKAPNLAWELPRNDSIRSSPIAVDGTVYVGSSRYGRLYALDAATGTEEWRFNASGAVGSPAYAHGIVYFGTSNGTLYAVNATTGVERWRRSLGSSVGGSPTLVNGTIFVAATNSSTSGNVYALDADTGKSIWRHHVDGYANATPAFGQGTVFASGGGNVTAIDASNGTVRWSTEIGINGNLTAPTVGPDRVWVGVSDPANNSGGLYSLIHHDADLFTDNGEVAFEFWHGDRSVGSPTLARDRVYVTVPDKVKAINTSTRNQEWYTDPAPTLTTAPIVAEKTIFVGTDSGPIAIDAEERPTSGAATQLGDTRWHWEIDGSGSQPRGDVRSAPVVLNNSMYVGFARNYNSLYKIQGEDYNHDPVAKFTVKPKHPAVGEHVVLNATKSYDLDGTITKYEWDTEGINYIETTGRVTTYRYTDAGYYDVNIRLTDDEGGLGSEGIDGIDVGGSTNFSVVNYTVSNADTRVGENVAVNATVENAGDGDGWMNVTLYDDGTAIREKTVLVLRGGNTTNVSFDVSFGVAGNHSLAVESRNPTNVTVRDETAPSAPSAVSGPEWADETADVSWLGATDNGAIDHYEVQVDDGTWTDVGSTTDTQLTDLTEGTHTVSVRAIDTGDNVGPANNTTIQVDTGDPSAPTISAPDGWIKDSATVTWGNVTDDASGFDHYEVRYDGGAWNPTETTSDTLSYYSTGNYTVSVRGVDVAGNRGPVVTETIHVDQSEPLVGVGLETTSGSDTATLTVNVTDRRSGVAPENVTILVDGEAVTGNLTVVGDSVVYTGDFSEGTHDVAVNATDALGNRVADEWTLDTGGSDDGNTGGGGGGGGGNVPPPSVRVEVVEEGDDYRRVKITNARADSPASVSLPGFGTPDATFHGLEVTPESTEAEPRFYLNASVVSNPAVHAPKNVETLGYLHVKPTYIGNDELASATVEFRVAADAADPERVALYHYRDGVWKSLSTKFVAKRGGEYVFRAEATGVSLFAVTVNDSKSLGEGAGSAPETTTEQVETTETTAPSEAADATTTKSSGSVGHGAWSVLVPLVALLLALVSRARRV